MKKTEATIRKTKLADVKLALCEQGLRGMSVSYIHGYGKETGSLVTYRGARDRNDFKERVRLELIVADEDVEKAVGTILQAAQTGITGDGQICVTNLESYIHIRTGEMATDAKHDNVKTGESRNQVSLKIPQRFPAFSAVR